MRSDAATSLNILEMAEELLAVVVILSEPRHDLSWSHQVDGTEGLS